MLEPERTRFVCRAREHGLTFAVIAGMLGCSAARAAQLYDAATWPARPLMADGRPLRRRRWVDARRRRKAAA